MNSKRLERGEPGTFLIVFDMGDEVTEGLLSFAREHGIEGASFTGIGAFQRATLGFFDLDRKDYLEIPIDEQVEVLTLAGNLGVHEGEPKLHAHVVVGKRDGSAMGGHLLNATVRPTLEVVVRGTPEHLKRTIDQTTGLPLLDVAP